MRTPSGGGLSENQFGGLATFAFEGAGGYTRSQRARKGRARARPYIDLLHGGRICGHYFWFGVGGVSDWGLVFAGLLMER
jgi:hypothetical protein